MEVIDLLSTINELVGEDIRDKFVYPKGEGLGPNENSCLNNSQTSNKLNTCRLSKQGSNSKRKSTNTNLKENGIDIRKKSKQKISFW